MAPATHQVVALFDFGEQQGDVRRIVLQIAIEGDDHLAATGIESSGHGGCLAVVAAEQHRHEFGNFFAQLGQHGGRGVFGTVIHQDDLEGHPEGANGGQ